MVIMDISRPLHYALATFTSRVIVPYTCIQTITVRPSSPRYISTDKSPRINSRSPQDCRLFVGEKCHGILIVIKWEHQSLSEKVEKEIAPRQLVVEGCAKTFQDVLDVLRALHAQNNQPDIEQ